MRISMAALVAALAITLAPGAGSAATKLSSVDRAFTYLSSVMDQDARVYYLYQDADAGSNHGYPSGWYNGDANMRYDHNWAERPFSGTSCIRVTWNGKAGRDETYWNGVMFQAYEGQWKGKGVDLTGVTQLTFAARTDTPGLELKISVGLPTDSCRELTSWVKPSSEWQVFSIPLTGKDLSNLNGLFGFVFNDRHTPDPRKGCTFYLDEIAYDKAWLEEPRLLRSFDMRTECFGEGEQKRDLRRLTNIAYLYDNAVAMLAYMARGTEDDWRRAKLIADAMLLCQNFDRDYTDGRLRNGYRAGYLMYQAVPDGKTTAALPGMWKPIHLLPSSEQEKEDVKGAGGRWEEDVFSVSTHAGNLAWAMLALLQYYEKRGGDKYLEAARKLGDWVEEHCQATKEFGGFRGGVGGPSKTAPGGYDVTRELTYGSAEHNIDLYSAFTRLGKIDTVNAARWQACAGRAKEFVDKMWSEDHVLIGTNEAGTGLRTDFPVLDTNTWSLLAFGLEHRPNPESPTTYRESLRWAERRFAVQADDYDGFGFSLPPGKDRPDGIWWEGTAQMVAAYRQVGNMEQAQRYLRQLERAQDKAAQHSGLPAASREDADTGLEGWRMYRTRHVGATAWFIFAALGYNPFSGARTDDGMLQLDPQEMPVTPIPAQSTPPITLKPKAPPEWEYSSFGDIVHHSTNFFCPGFDAAAGWAENRLFYGGSDVVQAHHVRPYLKLTLAACAQDYEWANNDVYGLGLEIRPWAHPFSPYAHESLPQQLLGSTRFYAEWLGIRYTQQEVTGADQDLRLGVELWREWNVAPRGYGCDLEFTKNWAELYANLAWYDTRFTWYCPDYHALGLDATAWIGTRGPQVSRNVYLMPYLRPGVCWTSRHSDYFWQNKASLAAGVRVMPFQGSSSPWLNQLKVYGEYMRVVDYLRDSATPETPSGDWRLGLAYQLNRY